MPVRPATLTPKMLAERWQTSPGHLSNLRGQGRGPAFLRIGTAIRYLLADVEQFEENARVQGFSGFPAPEGRAA